VLNFELIEKDDEVSAYLNTADENFAAIGYKEHGLRHAKLSANIAGNVLKYLGYSEQDQLLAKISAYMHDIGNAVSANDHAQTGAMIVLDILQRMQFPYEYIFPIITAIGTHEDKSTNPVSAIAAALVLADKTDVHRTRVRGSEQLLLDTHSRVNYACRNAFLRVEKDKKTIALELTIDTNICPVMDYFEIFLPRTNFCIKASAALNCAFELYINKDKFY